MRTDYICDDRDMSVSKEFIEMLDDEIEDEFEKRFGTLNDKKSDDK